MRAFIAALLGLILFGAVAGIAYQFGLSAAGAAGAPAVAPAYPYYWHPFAFGFGFFGLLFPLFFLFLLFGLARAAFGGHWGYGSRSRMLEQWHREFHDRERTPAAPDRTDR